LTDSLFCAVVYSFQKEVKNVTSFIRNFDIKFRDDCVYCKFISAAVCYGCGIIVFQTVKSIPASNLPAKVMTGVFGAGLFGMGTMRLFQEPTKPPAEQTSSTSTNQDSSR